MFTNSMNPLALQAQWILGGPESPCYVGHSTKERTERNSDTMQMNDIPFLGLFRDSCSALILEVRAYNHEIF